jgi:hypothetical protein
MPATSRRQATEVGSSTACSTLTEYSKSGVLAHLGVDAVHVGLDVLGGQVGHELLRRGVDPVRVVASECYSTGRNRPGAVTEHEWQGAALEAAWR